VIRDDDDLSRHVEYIHYNPVKHGLAESAHKYRYSSFLDYVQQGLYDDTWGVSDGDLSDYEFGE
jgi:putative transposase